MPRQVVSQPKVKVELSPNDYRIVPEAEDTQTLCYVPYDSGDGSYAITKDKHYLVVAFAESQRDDEMLICYADLTADAGKFVPLRSENITIVEVTAGDEEEAEIEVDEEEDEEGAQDEESEESEEEEK
ncbi:MAG: hypothetical protein U0Q18_37040 [Bryobacteraceae bacterium]